MSNVVCVEHPLMEHSLTILRDKHTDTESFRHHAGIVSQIMVITATSDIPMTEKQIETPLAEMTGHHILHSVVFVPVLRAGISMLFPARNFLPWAPVGFIGLERDEATAIAREYYQKFPKNLKDKQVLVLDPMLATGGSLVDTIDALKKKGAVSIAAVCIVAAPEGIELLSQKHPDVRIYTAAIDSHLNEFKYIVPGLGDFGDRYFGTL
ncbi:uracil phosphoribosyltransferase [candidate division KSB1 bacterium]|nr:uracil phosphoribosyltransferase [candidate division KSB1 bacterium]